MANKLPEVDAVLIGVGLVGAILGRELTRAGLKVVGLERGEPRFTVPDFQGPQVHDELRYSIRKALMQDNTKEAMTFRNNTGQTALPLRRWEGFLPSAGLGGAAVHWNGQTYRFVENDFRQRTLTTERYGKNFIPDDVTIQDWGVTGV
jgi:gluconate 2-dehydrogenase alpha chain